MHSSLIAVVLCIFAQASVACLSTTTNDNAQQAAAPITARVIKTQAAGAALPGAELIATAAAGTRNAPAARPATRVNVQPDDEQPRRAGPAMLLAALALMSGIALRRYGAGSQ
ncbi:MAG: hypothetical protein ABI409_21635 [Ramlibacter sp.]